MEVHSVRTAIRRSRRGAPVADLVVEITQRRRGYFKVEDQAAQDALPPVKPDYKKEDFIYRAGCTLIIDPSGMQVRWVIRTPGTIADDAQLEKMRRFVAEGGLEPENAFHSGSRALKAREPFALLHRHEDD